MATKTYRITEVGEGNASVTINATAGQHSAPAWANIGVTCTVPPAGVYGVYWDGSQSTAMTRTDNGIGITEPVAGIRSTTGSSIFDHVSPWQDIEIVDDADLGKLVSIPKFYYKLTQDTDTGNDGIKIQICDASHSSYALSHGYHVSPAHMDRGDGQGERSVVYVGRYLCDKTTYKSISGVQTTYNNNGLPPDVMTAIHNLNSNAWGEDFATVFTIWLLYLVEYADWDFQSKIGGGNQPTSSSANTGQTDSMAYHTGTSASSRSGNGVVQYRHIEYLVMEYLEGIYNDSSSMRIILNPSSFSHSTGGVSIGAPPVGYIKKLQIKNVAGTYPLFVAKEVGATRDTYACMKLGYLENYPYMGIYYANTYPSILQQTYFWQQGSQVMGSCRIMKLP